MEPGNWNGGRSGHVYTNWIRQKFLSASTSLQRQGSCWCRSLRPKRDLRNACFLSPLDEFFWDASVPGEPKPLVASSLPQAIHAFSDTVVKTMASNIVSLRCEASEEPNDVRAKWHRRASRSALTAFPDTSDRIHACGPRGLSWPTWLSRPESFRSMSGLSS